MFTTPLILKKNNSYRPIHKIDITAFNDDILNSDLFISPAVHECDIYIDNFVMSLRHYLLINIYLNNHLLLG